MTDEIRTFRARLENDPTDQEALEHLESLLFEGAKFDELYALYDARSEAMDVDAARMTWGELVGRLEDRMATLGDASERAALDLLVGRILDQALDLPDDAHHFYMAAHRLDPENLGALQACRELSLRRQQWGLAFQLAALEARATEDTARQVPLFFCMAEVCESRLERPAAAYRWATKVLELDAEHPGARAIQGRTGDAGQPKEARYRALQEEVRTVRDRRQRSAMMVDRASAWFDEAPDDPWVEEALRAVLVKDPRNATARSLLDEYYEANHRWLELSRYLAERVRNTPRKSDRLTIYKRLAEVAQFNLQDDEQAVNWHREVLRLSPIEKQSLQYCVDYYSQREDWRGLVGVYEAALRTRHRGGDEAAMLVQIAMLLWKKLDDHDAAEGYFRRIKLGNPRHALMLQFYTEYFEKRADYKRLLNVLSARQAAATEPEQRLVLGMEMADIAENQVGNREKAIDIWKGLLKLEPDLPEARDALRRLYEAARKWNALLEFYKEDLRSLPDGDVMGAIDLYTQMIAIYRDRLRLPVMVVNMYNQILQLDPENRDALEALEERYRRGSRWNDLVQILDRRAELAKEAGELETYLGICSELAGLWSRRFSNQAKAAEYLEEVLAHRPDDLEVVERLIASCRHRKDWHALFDAYQRKLALLPDEERITLLSEMADLAVKRLDNLGEAVEIRRQIIELTPEDESAWSALQKLLIRGEQWQELASLYADRAAQTPGVEGVKFLRKLAELSIGQLDDTARAAGAWHDILERQPDDKAAEASLKELYIGRRDWDALEQLFGTREKWSVLVGVLSGLVERSDDAILRCQLLERMAAVCADELDDAVAANECWERILTIDPGHAAAAEILVPSYREAGQWRRLADVLSAELTAAPEPAFDRLLDLAQVYDEQLQAPAEALEWYAAALRAEPSRVDALEALERIVEPEGQLEFFVDLLEHLLPDSEAAQEIYLARLADLSGRVLGRFEAAAEYFVQLIDLGRDEPETLAELGGLYERLQRWDDRRALYEHQLERATGQDNEADLLRQLAEMQLEQLDDPEGARESYTRLLEVSPHDEVALLGLQTIADRTGDLAALAEYVQVELEGKEETGERARLLCRLAGIQRQLSAEPDAIESFIEALRIDPSHAPAEVGLCEYLGGEFESLVSEFLTEHFERVEKWDGLVLVLRASLDSADDRYRKAELHQTLAMVLDEHLGNQTLAFEAYGACLLSGSEESEAQAQFERLGADLGRELDIVELYEGLSFDGNDRAETDEQAAAYGLRAAELLEQQGSRIDRARDIVARIADEIGDSLELLDRLEALSTRLEDWGGLVGVLTRRVDLLDADQDIVATWHRVAELSYEALGDTALAVEAYERVREIEPDDERSIAGQERLFSELGDHRALADLLESRLESRSGEERSRVLLQLARLYENELAQPLAAVSRYADLLKEGGEPGDILDAVEDLLVGVSDHPDAALVREEGCQLLLPHFVERGDQQGQLRLLQFQLEDLDIPEERAELRQKIASIYETELEQPEAAFASFGAAFTEEYPTEAAAEGLFRLAETLELWGDLAAILGSVLQREDLAHQLEPAVRVSILHRAAELFEGPAEQPEAAINCNLLLLQDDPDDLKSLRRLEGLYETTGDVDRLVDTLERRLELEDDETRLELGMRLGTLLENRLEQLERATDVYLSIRPDMPEDDHRAHQALARLLPAAGRWAELVDVFSEHAERVEPEERIGLLVQTAQLYEGQLDNPDEAITAYVEVLQIDPGHHEALIRLDRLYSDAGRSSELLDILERELQTEIDDDHRAQLEFRRGHLLADELGETLQAVRAFESVLGLQADHSGARSALEALVDDVDAGAEAARILLPVFEADGEWERVRDLIRAALEEDGTVEHQVQQLTRLAEIEEVRLGDARAAFTSLSEAYQLSEGEETLGLEFERLGLQLEAYAELAEIWSELAPLMDEREAETRLKTAQLCELHLDEPDRAIQEYREVLELDPGNVHAYGALEQLLGRGARYHELVDLLEQRVSESEEDAQTQGLLRRLAQLFEDALEDAESSLSAWKRLLEVDPGNEDAMGNVERLLEREERWDELVEQLAYRRDQSEPEVGQTVELLRARVLESCLGQGEEAVRIYQGILEESPDHSEAEQALLRLFEDHEYAASVGVDVDDVVPTLETVFRARGEKNALIPILDYRQETLIDEVEQRVALLRELAGLSQETTGDSEGTLRYLLVLFDLTVDPDVQRTLGRVARALGRVDEYANVLAERIIDAGDEEERRALSYELARTYVDDCGDHERGLAVYLDLLDERPGEEEALTAVVGLYSRAGDWDSLVGFYIDQAESSSEGAGRIGLLRKACELLEDVVGDAERAIDVWQMIVEDAPSDDAARSALERLLIQGERWDQLVALCSQRAEDIEYPQERARLRCRLAEFQMKGSDGIDGAIGTLSIALEEDPEGLPAAEMMEHLLATARRNGAIDERLRLTEVLREHFARTEAWGEWCGLLEQELNYTEDAWERQELLAQIARRQEENLDSPERALDTWCRAFASDYGNQDARQEMERLAQTHGAWLQLTDAYENGLEDYDDLDGAMELLARIAEIRENELQDIDGAIGAFGRILELDESNQDALDALLRLIDAEARPLDAVAVQQRKAQFGDTAQERKAAYLECARLLESSLGNAVEATEHYRLALEEDPDDVSVIDELIRLYEGGEAWEQAVFMLVERLELTADPASQRALHNRIASHQDQHLGHIDDAIQNLQAAIELEGDSKETSATLDALLVREARWPALVDLLEMQQQEREESEGSRCADTEVRIASVYAERMDEPRQAVERLAELLETTPGFAPAIALLETLLTNESLRLEVCQPLLSHYLERSPSDLARIYQAELSVLDDRYERSERFQKLGAVQHTELSSPIEAFECYAAAFALTPEDFELTSILEELAQTATLHTRLAQVYEAQADSIADEQVVTGLNRKLGQLYEAQIPQPDRAIERWSLVLDAQSFDTEALGALDRLYTGTERWGDLKDTLYRRMDLVEGQTALDLRCRLGRLVEAIDGDVTAAVELHRDVLWEDSSHGASRGELERLMGYRAQRTRIAEVLEPIYQEREDWERLATLTEMRLPVCEEPEMRAALWMRAADIRTERLDQRDSAFENLCAALEEAPDDTDVRDRLLEMGETDARWVELTSSLAGAAARSSDPERALADHLLIAGWSDERLNDRRRAIAHYTKALEIDDQNVTALTNLERLYNLGEDWNELVETLLRRAEASFDPDERKPLLQQAGRILAENLAEGQRAVGVFEECLELDPEDSTTIDALDVLYTGMEQWSALAGLLEQRIEHTPDDDALELLSRLGWIWQEQLAEPARSIAAFEQMLELDPDSHEARGALRNLYTSTERWGEMEELLLREVETETEPLMRAALLMELARNAMDRLERGDSAIDYGQQALALTPDDGEAFEFLAHLLEADARWYDLVDAQQAYLAAVADDPSFDRTDLLLQMGRIASTQLMDNDLAIRSLTEVLELSPEHVGALTILGEIYQRDGDWPRAVETLEQALGLAADDAERADTLVALGEMYHTHLDEPDKARDYFEQAVSLGMNQRAIDALLNHYVGPEELGRLLELTELQIRGLDGIARQDALARSASLKRKAGDITGAIQDLEGARRGREDDLRLTGLLADLYGESGRVEQAETLLTELASGFESARRYKDVLDCRFRLACLAEDRGDQAKAMAAFQACFEVDASHLPTLLRYGALLAEAEEWADAVRVLQSTLLQQSKLSDEQRLALFWRLGCARQALGEARKAKDMYSRVLNLDPEHAGAKEALEKLAAADG